MKSVKATLAVAIIETMIVTAIAAALKNQILSDEYKNEMNDYKTRLAELFEETL